jgi:hypothetical protein
MAACPFVVRFRLAVGLAVGDIDDCSTGCVSIALPLSFSLEETFRLSAASSSKIL